MLRDYRDLAHWLLGVLEMNQEGLDYTDVKIMIDKIKSVEPDKVLRPEPNKTAAVMRC
jgi:hypothetical protein